MLECDAVLDIECMHSIITSGHSRIPVYIGNNQNVVGVLIVKNIILVDPLSGTRHFPPPPPHFSVSPIFHTCIHTSMHTLILADPLTGTKVRDVAKFSKKKN
jgi:CBS domain containing-hemolysin-like protein